MWVLVLVVAAHGGLYGNSTAVATAMTNIPGYLTEGACQQAAKHAIAQMGNKVTTACIPGTQIAR